ncbi:hypothetical protein D3227_29120 [Mesorhizobium waimense]|uniref:Uncharacterized protein n=1 Tax=Mesorhizobium waimense TaxID=1300307 RepID=A0A3A5KE89_9HYPH|nr:hypothetical protein D3227_29120 [Mesorhizobium waimense]
MQATVRSHRTLLCEDIMSRDVTRRGICCLITTSGRDSTMGTSEARRERDRYGRKGPVIDPPAQCPRPPRTSCMSPEAGGGQCHLNKYRLRVETRSNIGQACRESFPNIFFGVATIVALPPMACLHLAAGLQPARARLQPAGRSA